LKKPPAVLLANVQRLEAQHKRIGNQISKYLSKMLEGFPIMKEEYIHQGIEHDQLFEATYNHISGKPVDYAIKARLSGVLRARSRHLESITVLLGPPTRLLRTVLLGNS
jgi:hypothetical protein